MVEISQKHSFTESFGEVLRSSAIFYVRQSGGVSTTITFMDYWKAKRDIDVAVVATARRMDGTLIGRTRLRFDGNGVINFRPDLGDAQDGSVEIEIFSVENMVYPYPAIMAFYETPQTISMVHSYARAYSRHEVEEHRVITLGEESNWTVRDTASVRSFCVFHNGAAPQPAQTVRLVVRTLDGRRKDAEIALGALSPYESRKLFPADAIPGLAAFLGGAPGQASMSFRLGESFTRMLVGNEAVDGSDLQVTHSDFNFNVHKTDCMTHDGAPGLLRVPKLRDMKRWVVVYPEQDPGRYSVSDGSSVARFASGEPQVLEAAAGVEMFEFHRDGGALPTRINAGIGCATDGRWLPAEPSLGVMHDEIPAKRMTWGPCAVGGGVATDVVVHAYDSVFGPVPPETKLSFRLYSATRGGYLERMMGADALDALDRGMPVEDVFDGAEAFLGGEPGYFTLFSEYGGLKAYVLMKKASGSATFEHCF